MNYKHPLSVLTLALAAALPLSLPLAVQAQPRATNQANNDAAWISTIGVEQVRRLRAGTVLDFSLEGTPRADVRLTIAGATAPVQMTERRPGWYEGSYTIRPRDRLTATSVATAQVYKDGQSASATLSRSLLLGAPDLAPTAATQITNFTVSANDRVRPGDEVGFAMTGTPGGQASVAIRGLTRRIPLTEVRRGVYEGSYVVRRGDRLGGELQADGYLQFDRREMSQRYERQAARAEAQERREDRREERREERRDERDDARAAREAREAEAVRQARQQAAFCANCGSVESVNLVDVKGDAPNVIGTIAGGVLGGVIGNQVGGGSGKDIATVIGAIGGAYAGNRVENNMDKRRVFRVGVRMEGGTTQNFDYADDPKVSVGTRVKVENGVLLRM